MVDGNLPPRATPDIWYTSDRGRTWSVATAIFGAASNFAYATGYIAFDSAKTAWGLTDAQVSAATISPNPTPKRTPAAGPSATR